MSWVPVGGNLDLELGSFVFWSVLVILGLRAQSILGGVQRTARATVRPRRVRYLSGGWVRRAGSRAIGGPRTKLEAQLVKLLGGVLLSESLEEGVLSNVDGRHGYEVWGVVGGNAWVRIGEDVT